MFRDMADSLSAYLRDRVANPLGGAFFLSLMAWNYRAIFVLFADEPVAWRFAYIDVVLYPGWDDRLLSLVVYPALLAAFYLFIYPVIARPVYAYVLQARTRLQSIKHKAEGAQLLTVDQGNRIRRSSQEREQRYAASSTLLEERIDAIQVELAEEQKKVAERDSIIGELKTSFASSTEEIQAKAMGRAELKLAASHSRRKMISSFLLSHDFILHFNPKNSGTKRMTFMEGGEIGLGRNQNENTWRVEDGNLEFMNDKGEIFSRFHYESDSGGFVMEPFEGQPAIEGQFLLRVTEDDDT